MTGADRAPEDRRETGYGSSQLDLGSIAPQGDSLVGSPSTFDPTRLRVRTETARWPLERLAWWATSVVAGMLLLLVLALTVYGFSHRHQIYQGVSVSGIDLSGLSRAEATDRLEAAGASYGRTPMTLDADGETFVAAPSGMGFDLDSAGTAERAFSFGRDGSLWRRTQDWVIGLTSGAVEPPEVQVDRGMLNSYLAARLEDLHITPVDARVDLSSGSPVLQPDANGRDLDVDGSAARVTAALRAVAPGPVSLITSTTQPTISAASLQGSVPLAIAATDSPFTLTATEGSWGIDQARLSQIVTVDPATAKIEVDRGAVETVVSGLATEIDRLAVNAGIQVGADGGLTVVRGQDAATVDVRATTDQAVARIASGADTIDVTVVRSVPGITDAMATSGIAEANSYLDAGMTITWDGGKQQLKRADLLQALVIYDTGGDPFLFQFDADIIGSLVAPAFDRVDDPAEDARFRLVDGKVTQTQRSGDGRVVDREATMSDVIDGIYGHKPQVPMVVVDDKATVTDHMGKSIQTPDMLAQGITYYTGSSEPRRQNIERAASLEDGWLVPPDGIFSYDELLGDVDGGNGFDTGFGIVADEERGGVTTAPVMGGGICQVSTTIFQAAWWSGLEVVERYQHPYWLSGYGVAPLGREGLDAMVNIEDDWSLDLKLRNTTGNWIAFVVTADGDALTVSLMGTDPKWMIAVSDPIETGRTTASDETEYVDSPELAAGEELQVEHAADGFSVRVDRTVTDRSGNEILSDNVESDYAPSRNLILRGAGGSS